jgi:hypothetical protein
MPEVETKELRAVMPAAVDSAVPAAPAAALVEPAGNCRFVRGQNCPWVW